MSLHELQINVIKPLQASEGGLSQINNPLFVMLLTSDELEELADYAEADSLTIATEPGADLVVGGFQYNSRFAFACGEPIERPMDCEVFTAKIDDMRPVKAPRSAQMSL